MAKLVSPSLELRVIKTLTKSSNQKESALLFSRIKEDCFQTTAGQQCFARIMTLLRERSELVSWGELCVDPVLNELVREKLTRFEEKAIPVEKIDRAVEVLHKYRRGRAFLKMSNHLVSSLQAKSLDVEKLTEDVTKMLLDARSNAANVQDWFVDIGGDSKKDIREAKKLLINDEKRLIPTGIKAFDSRSGGIPRGSLFLLGGNTGSGKTIVVSQLSENMAKNGGRVCVVPLEMKNTEMLRRQLTRTADLELTRLANPKTLSSMEKDQAIERFRKMREKIKRMNGLLSLFSPEEDMTAEEILILVQTKDYDVVIIDLVTMLKGVDGDDQWRAMRNVTRFCKRYAAIHDIVIVLVCQISDEGMVRYSKGMVEDSSNAWFFRATAQSRETGVVWIDQPKARESETFKFPIVIDYPRMVVRDLTDEENEQATKAKEKPKHGDKKKLEKFTKIKHDKKESDDFFDTD